MDSISLLLRDLKGCPRFTKEEERALAGRFATADEAQEAREQLILSCVPFAFALSKRYFGRGLQQGDVIQEAMLGLIEAVDSLDPSLGRLTTWVRICVRKRILYAIPVNLHAVRLPHYVFWGGRDSPHQAKADRVREGIQSLDTGYVCAEHESALQVDDTTDAVAEALWLDEAREALEYAMGSLTERERQIIRLRKAGMTLGSVGRQLGISRESVRQIQAVAMDKLRQTLDCAGAVA